VLCVSHFQCLLRRSAFDTAFDLVRSNNKLQALSFMDTLTGGYNRRYLEQTLGIEVARAVRFNRPLSVMMFDLDNFKAVNDTRGHAAGDEVLREVWQATLGTLREVDAAARYGGDEFSIILPETDEAAAYGVAERLQAAIRYRLHARFGPASPEGRVTASIGIVTARPGETGTPTPDYLIDAADERLYEAKRRGKDIITS
jgi:diguanylate cyclase (GGDEF)-like protein